MNKTSLMTRKFFRMLFSGTIGCAMLSAILMANTIIAGAVLGSKAVMAVTLISPIYAASSFLAQTVTVSFPILYSRSMGRMDKEDADKIFGQGMVNSILMGILIFAFLSLGHVIIRMYNPSEEVFILAMDYLFWMRFSGLCLPLVCLINAAVYADGDELIYNVASISQMVVSIILSACLCSVMGISGIGLGFFIAILISIIISFLHLLREGNSLRLNLYFSWKKLWDTIKYSITDSGKQLFAAAFTAVMNLFVMTSFGEEYLLIVSGAILLQQFQMFLDGIGQGASPILGVYLGEDNYAGVRNTHRIAEHTAVVMGLILMAVVLMIAPLVPSMLGADESAISGLLINGMRIMAISSVFSSLLYWHTSYYLVINRIVMSFSVTGLKDMVAPIICGCTLGFIAGPYGLFAGLMIAPILTWLAVELFLRRTYDGEDYRLLLKDIDQKHNSYLFEFPVDPDHIVAFRDDAEEILKKENLSKSLTNRIMVLLEELFMLIYDNNSGRKILGECTLNIGEKVEVIARDNGKCLDLTDPDMQVSSLRVFIISNLIEDTVEWKRQMTAMGLNRNRFVI